MTAPESARSEAGLGARVRDYDVWGLLGEGGMGQVWLARHVLLALPVVLKTVRRQFETDASGEARVLLEAKLMARIASPRVVRAIDAGVHAHRAYLVEEYVDGIDLAELDRRRRSALGVGLPLWAVCEAMHAACDALHAAHQTGVVHRDVKPSNLFGSPHTGLRLGDFGIAAIARDPTRMEISGTLRFMAPEQLRGEEPNALVDVWGAGATAFDLRYGQPPFLTPAEILDPNLEPPFPKAESPAEAYFQHVVAGMLAKNPEARTGAALEPLDHFATLGHMLRAKARRGQVLSVSPTTLVIDECKVTLRVGNLADAEADAIVSSANDTLLMRSGVADALRRAGGDAIEDEVLALGHKPLGSCVSTGAGTLRAKNVLHAVSAWNEASCVGRATQRALLLADELGHRHLAVAALGTGAARVSMEASASAMMTSLRHHIALGASRLRHVEVVLWDEAGLRTYQRVAEEALRGHGEVVAPDVGRMISGGEVRVDGATFLDTSKRPRR
jgi:serine/threonine-protein kinase